MSREELTLECVALDKQMSADQSNYVLRTQEDYLEQQQRLAAMQQRMESISGLLSEAGAE